MSADHKYSIAVDFDGVIHSYTSPWAGAATIPDPAVDGAIDWLAEMLGKFKVYIFSTRCESRDARVAMRSWLRDNGLGERADEIEFTTGKPACLIYIDDRGYRFEGRFPTADQIHRAVPWNKKPKPRCPYCKSENISYVPTGDDICRDCHEVW